MRERKRYSEKFRLDWGKDEFTIHIFSNEDDKYQMPGINVEKIESGHAKKIHAGTMIRIDKANEILHTIVKSSNHKYKGPTIVGKYDDEYDSTEIIFEDDKSLTHGKNWEKLWKEILDNSNKAKVYYGKKWIRKYI